MPEIIFILYKPAVPGNIGASARALKTMGFSSLRLIDPCDHLSPEARMMAHGSVDVLEQAVVYNSFEKAASDLDLIICTTARERSAKHDYYPVRELLSLIRRKGEQLGKTGILFGTEESGLPNDLVLRSDIAVTIPMIASYPSLNLSQAVMIVAYELSVLNTLVRPGKELKKEGRGWSTLKEKSEKLLEDTGILKGTPLYHRIMERLATTGKNDIPLFLSVISRVEALRYPTRSEDTD